MIYNPITAVGIDVSKAKSTVAIRRPGGEVVMLPFDVQHNMEDIQQLISTLRKVAGDIKNRDGAYRNVLASHCTDIDECRLLCQYC